MSLLELLLATRELFSCRGSFAQACAAFLPEHRHPNPSPKRASRAGRKANRGGQNRVVPLPDPMVVAAWKEGTWAEKPKKIGHWLMLRDAKTVNAVMEDWLKKTE